VGERSSLCYVTVCGTQMGKRLKAMSVACSPMASVRHKYSHKCVYELHRVFYENNGTDNLVRKVSHATPTYSWLQQRRMWFDLLRNDTKRHSVRLFENDIVPECCSAVIRLLTPLLTSEKLVKDVFLQLFSESSLAHQN